MSVPRLPPVDYFLCFVGSVNSNVCRGLGVGGMVFPFTPVTSVPVSPPRGPLTLYWPDTSQVSPGFLLFAIYISWLVFPSPVGG